MDICYFFIFVFLRFKALETGVQLLETLMKIVNVDFQYVINSK